MIRRKFGNFWGALPDLLRPVFRRQYDELVALLELSKVADSIIYPVFRREQSHLQPSSFLDKLLAPTFHDYR